MWRVFKGAQHTASATYIGQLGHLGKLAGLFTATTNHKTFPVYRLLWTVM